MPAGFVLKNGSNMRRWTSGVSPQPVSITVSRARTVDCDGPDREHTLSAHGIARVQREIEQNALNLLKRSSDEHGLCREIELQPDPQDVKPDSDLTTCETTSLTLVVVRAGDPNRAADPIAHRSGRSRARTDARSAERCKAVRSGFTSAGTSGHTFSAQRMITVKWFLTS